MARSDLRVKLRTPFAGLVDPDQQSYTPFGASEQPIQFDILTNFDIAKQGQLKKRPGYLHLGAIDINGLIGFFNGNLMAADLGLSNSTLYKMISHSATPSNQVVLPFEMWDGVAYNNNFFVTARTGGGLIYQVTSALVASSITGSPTVTDLAIHKDRLFGFDWWNDENRLYFSKVGDFSATGWVSTNFVDVFPGDGGQINDIISYRDLLLIGKSTGLWSLYTAGDPTNWILRRLSNETIPVIGQRTMVLVNEYVYFMNNFGIYKTDGSSIVKISQQVESFFEDGFGRELHYFDGKLLALMYNINAGAYSFFVLVYDIDSGTWTQWDPPPSGNVGFQWAYLTDPTGVYGYQLTSTGGLTYLDSLTIDNEQDWDGPIPGTFKTKEYFLGEGNQYKRVKQLTADCRAESAGTTLELDVELDQQSRTFDNTARTLSAGRQFVKFPHVGMCRSFRLLGSVEMADDFELFEIELRATPHRDL